MGSDSIGHFNPNIRQNCSPSLTPIAILRIMRVPGRSRRSQSAVEASITTVLAEVRPLLHIDHCRIELVRFSYDSGLLDLAIEGSCSHCNVSPATFSPAISAHVKMRVPEVFEVRISDRGC